MFLKNKATSLYLDSNANSAFTQAYNGGNSQKWKLIDNRLYNVATNLLLASNFFGTVLIRGVDQKTSSTTHFTFEAQ